MTAPSNASTSGLAQDLCERLDAILIEESPMHPFGCSTWEEASRVAIDMAKEVIVTAASAQARIDAAELHWKTWAGAKVAESQQVEHFQQDRATAAEARADRLADIVRRCVTALDASRSGGEYPDFEEWEKDARAALQQETQP